MKRAAIAAAVVALGAAPVAHAAVHVVFDRAAAHVGDRIVVRSGYAPGRGIVVYLVALRDAPRFSGRVGNLPAPAPGPPTRSTRLHRVGLLDAHGRLAFRVPRVRPGLYTTVVWCKPCGNDHWASAFPPPPDVDLSIVDLNDAAILRVKR